MSWFCKHEWKEIRREPVTLTYRYFDSDKKSKVVKTSITYQCQKGITHYKQVRLSGWIGLDPREWVFPETTVVKQ